MSLRVDFDALEKAMRRIKKDTPDIDRLEVSGDFLERLEPAVAHICEIGSGGSRVRPQMSFFGMPVKVSSALQGDMAIYDKDGKMQYLLRGMSFISMQEKAKAYANMARRARYNGFTYEF